MADELELIQSMSVLSLREGDTLVIKTNERHLTAETTAAIAAHVGRTTGDMPLMILEHGMDIGALRRDASSADTEAQRPSPPEGVFEVEGFSPWPFDRRRRSGPWSERHHDDVYGNPPRWWRRIFG